MLELNKSRWVTFLQEIILYNIVSCCIIFVIIYMIAPF